MRSIPLSVILPFYKGDDANHLAEALKSLDQQRYRAQEVVLVQDGPVGDSLMETVRQWCERMPEIRLIERKNNGGLSAALNTGIEAAEHEWIARMDADDICLPDRFEKQWIRIQVEPAIALIGSWIEEYDDQMRTPIALRRLPDSHDEILAYARWRCPFNHMTVLYRSSALKDIGVYRDYGAVGDDYELWARFLMRGFRTANIPEVLVKARTGKDFFSNRRRGWKYLKHEIREINELYRMGLLRPWHYVFHFAVKSIVRLSPAVLVRLFYGVIRKTF